MTIYVSDFGDHYQGRGGYWLYSDKSLKELRDFSEKIKVHPSQFRIGMVAFKLDSDERVAALNAGAVQIAERDENGKPRKEMAELFMKAQKF